MFESGEFLLVAKVHLQRKNKVEVKWTGPYRVVKPVSPWIFRVESISGDSATKLVHAQRLRLFSNQGMNLNKALEYIAVEETYLVDQLKDIRFDATKSLPLGWVSAKILGSLSRSSRRMCRCL